VDSSIGERGKIGSDQHKVVEKAAAIDMWRPGVTIGRGQHRTIMGGGEEEAILSGRPK